MRVAPHLQPRVDRTRVELVARSAAHARDADARAAHAQPPAAALLAAHSDATQASLAVGAAEAGVAEAAAVVARAWLGVGLGVARGRGRGWGWGWGWGGGWGWGWGWGSRWWHAPWCEHCSGPHAAAASHALPPKPGSQKHWSCLQRPWLLQLSSQARAASHSLPS